MTRKHIVDVTVNGRAEELEVQPGETLLSALRNKLGLTAAKMGCAAGQCGACTVIVDSKPALACLTLAAQVDGSSVTTTEGLPRDHSLGTTLVRHGGVQCGFCIPGIMMATVARFDTTSAVSEEEVRATLCGNLCRCTGYRSIVDGVVEWSGS